MPAFDSTLDLISFRVTYQKALFNPLFRGLAHSFRVQITDPRHLHQLLNTEIHWIAYSQTLLQVYIVSQCRSASAIVASNDECNVLSHVKSFPGSLSSDYDFFYILENCF